MDDRPWIRVEATVPPDAAAHVVELVGDALWSHDPPAVEERSADGGTTFVAAYPSPTVADAAARSAGHAGAVSTSVGPVDDDGLDAWRAHARPHDAGPFVVVPPWLPAPDRQVLVVDPGRTFGSGSHPTTRLVLAELDRVLAGTPDATVLDVGCGSGVLAIGAALLGARSALGIDVDPEAPATTAANAAANGVGERVSAGCEPLASIVSDGRTYDVVAANLFAPVIVELADDLAAVVAPGGTLLLSGLLVDRWQDAVGAVVAAGDPELEVVGTAEEEGWVVVRLRRHAPADAR